MHSGILILIRKFESGLPEGTRSFFMSEKVPMNEVETTDEIIADLHEPRFIVETGLPARVAQLVEPILNDIGFRLVRVKTSSSGGETLQIMAERPDGFINIEDCEAINDAVSPILDLEDPIAAEYRLEISSPGIDRPLVRISDLQRAEGHEVRVELAHLVNNRKRYRGLILGAAEGKLVLEKLEVKEGEDPHVIIELSDLAEVRLVLTDELIRQSLRAGKTAEKEQKELKRETRKQLAVEKRKPKLKTDLT